MPAARPPIPLADYQRIFRVLKTVFDQADINTAHSAIFFSVAGAHLVEHFYKKRCQPVAGAAYYKLDDEAGSVLSFADQNKNHDNASSGTGFHCWVMCDDYIVDFMAPLFRESLQSRGVTGNCSRKMFQKPRSSMVDSRLLLRNPGDSYLLPNVDLTRQILEGFFSTTGNQDLLDVCTHWYKKPPKDMPRQLSVTDNEGAVSEMTLSDLTLVGAW
jgi:hypothetical protein